MGRPQLQAPAAAREDRNEQPPNSARPRASVVLALRNRRLVATLVWWQRLGLAVPRQKLISVAAKVETTSPAQKVVKFADEMDLPIATAIMYDDQHSRVHVIPPPPPSSCQYYQSRGCAVRRAKAQSTHLKRPSSLSSAVKATDEIDLLSSSLVAVTLDHDDEEECSRPHSTSRRIMYDDQHRRVHLSGLASSYRYKHKRGENGRPKANRKHFLKRPSSSSSSSLSSSYERAEL
jgi:hypothetical protein